MNDELEPKEDRIIQDAEYIGVWMIIRRFMYGHALKGARGFHRHHQRVWAIFAAIFWAAVVAACVFGLITIIHIETTEKTCQLMGTCLSK